MAERARYGKPTLDRARRTGDGPADAAAAAILSERRAASGGDGVTPGELFRHLLAQHPDQQRTAPSTDRTPIEQRWLEGEGELPDWYDEARCERGRLFFQEWALEIGLGLFLAALPSAYAAEPGVPVLAATGQLEQHAQSRILETAQLVLDMGRPRTLADGGAARRTLRHVRLMHAGVRQLIGSDPRVSPPGDPDGAALVWEEHWGVPINQEHLAGTMVSFSHRMLDALDAMGLPYDQDAADDYLHLWAVAGHLLGVEDHLIPHDRASWRELSDAIIERNYCTSPFGVRLTRALLDVVEGYLPPLLRGLAPTTMRSMIGDDVAALLDVPRSDWTRFLLLGFRGISHDAVGQTQHSRLGRRVTRVVSMLVLRGFVEAQRTHRPTFEIPASLGIDTGGALVRRLAPTAPRAG